MRNLEYKDTVISDYRNGISVRKISDKYNIPISSVYRLLNGAVTSVFNALRDFGEEEQKKICELYLSGISTVEIGKMYGLTHKPIAKVLEAHNIPRTGECKRKYHVNEHYFDVIDTQEKAYCFGFLSADGHVHTSKGTVSMSLQDCDKEILERIRIEMDNDRPLDFVDYTNKHDFGYSYVNQYRMLIFSIYMCRKLNDLGLMNDKSFSLEFPEYLNEEFVSHYVRGYFDGNGSMGYKNINNYMLNPHPLTVSISTTYSFAKGLSVYLDKIGVKYIIRDASNQNGINASLNIRAKSRKTFLDWMYKDATIYLDRKYELYSIACK